jgi:hypothetical protein
MNDSEHLGLELLASPCSQQASQAGLRMQHATGKAPSTQLASFGLLVF